MNDGLTTCRRRGWVLKMAAVDETLIGHDHVAVATHCSAIGICRGEEDGLLMRRNGFVVTVD